MGVSGADAVKHFAACIKVAPPLPPACGGIYILAAPGGVVYVGQTVRPFAVRWQEHADDLRLGRHVNDALRRAWRAHGDLAAQAIYLCAKEHTVAWERWWMVELRRRGYVLANEVR